MNTKKFAKRFSTSDWLFLCSNSEFENAVTFGEWELAEVIAHKILSA